MIVYRQDGRLRLVTQGDHAQLAGKILAAWRADGVPRHPRREALLAATREHDRGWRGFDAAPPLDATGRPHDVFSLPAAHRLAVWRAASEEMASRPPWEALLVREHARRINHEQAGETGWDRLLADLDEQRERLLAECAGDSAAQLELDAALCADTDLLQSADTISLAACAGWERSSCVHCKIHVAGSRVALDPFPLAGPTTLRVPARWIEDRAYEDLPALATALARARWEPLAFQLGNGSRPAPEVGPEP